MLIYVTSLSTSWTFDRFLEKVIQLEWLGMPTNSSFSLLEELGVECIIDYGSS